MATKKPTKTKIQSAPSKGNFTPKEIKSAIKAGQRTLIKEIPKDFILVRPRKDSNTRSDYQLFVRASFKEKNYVSLGPYSNDSRVEEYCHKDDVEYYREIRNKELD